jgi:hypothetical protein
MTLSFYYVEVIMGRRRINGSDKENYRKVSFLLSPEDSDRIDQLAREGRYGKTEHAATLEEGSLSLQFNAQTLALLQEAATMWSLPVESLLTMIITRQLRQILDEARAMVASHETRDPGSADP